MKELLEILDRWDALQKIGAPDWEEHERMTRQLQRQAMALLLRSRRKYAVNEKGTTIAGPLSDEMAEDCKAAGILVEERITWGS